MHEIWKTVIYQGRQYSNFEVSNTGKLRNINTGTVYKQYINPKGYYQVCVSLGSKHKKKIFRLHKVVAETFIPNPENKPIPNHKDGNKLNNNVDNLEWSTDKENTRHAWDNGLCSARKGVEQHNSKLTEEEVRYIRDNYIPRHKEFGCRALARKFNVDHMQISRIVNYKSYTNVV